MNRRGFVVAMRARVLLSPFEKPFLRIHPPLADWLIVSRWGDDAEYLTISSAVGPAPSEGMDIPPFADDAMLAGGCCAPDGAAVGAAHDRRPSTGRGNGAPAPVGLHPRRTWFGVLMAESAKGKETAFLLTSHLPTSLPVAGIFAPAEGYARLCAPGNGVMRLGAVAREATPRTRLSQVTEGDLAPGVRGSRATGRAATGQVWTVHAERRPWSGEYPAGREGQR